MNALGLPTGLLSFLRQIICQAIHIGFLRIGSIYGAGNVETNTNASTHLQGSSLLEHRSSVSSNGAGPSDIAEENSNGFTSTNVHFQGSPPPEHRRSDSSSGTGNVERDDKVLATTSAWFYKSLPLERRRRISDSGTPLRTTDGHSLWRVKFDLESTPCEKNSPRQKSDVEAVASCCP